MYKVGAWARMYKVGAWARMYKVGAWARMYKVGAWARTNRKTPVLKRYGGFVKGLGVGV